MIVHWIKPFRELASRSLQCLGSHTNQSITKLLKEIQQTSEIFLIFKKSLIIKFLQENHSPPSFLGIIEKSSIVYNVCLGASWREKKHKNNPSTLFDALNFSRDNTSWGIFYITLFNDTSYSTVSMCPSLLS